MRGGKGVDTGGTAAQGIVAACASAYGNNAKSGSPKRDAAYCGASQCKQNPYGTPADRDPPDRKAADGDQATRESSAGKPAGRHVP